MAILVAHVIPVRKNVFVLMSAASSQTMFQLVQSYVFNASLVVSYHTIHSVGEDGAVADTTVSCSSTYVLVARTVVSALIVIPDELYVSHIQVQAIGFAAASL